MKDFRKTTNSQKIEKMMEGADIEATSLEMFFNVLCEHGKQSEWRAVSKLDYLSTLNNLSKIKCPKGYSDLSLIIVVELYQYYLKLRSGDLKASWKFLQQMDRWDLISEDLLITVDLAKENWKSKRKQKLGK